MADVSSLIFITGGVRSGKSSYAEKTALRLAEETGGRLHYIATGVASDNEMKERINRHQQERADSTFSWKTWEQPVNIGELASNFNQDDILLLDCLTTLVNNELFIKEEWDDVFVKGVQKKIIAGIDLLQKNCQTLMIVSNELLFDPVATNELVFTYSRLLGELHQQIVRASAKAYLVESGIPIMMKGDQV
ncbi:bifunctional adenosylcobinamide kinase/adenosylcobinamide-phosphate guanylyltransferase [Ferdinandcohnia quinoae]|uniref:Adenosylcobinamide kinase n=1 Tax=Fredinandcohnia quinoae TaxID=2918902 RepID=A0AAW5E4E2_9BACI|nr:bifunctional adenosylcobinamide kinase/adenosylcobinamide-phosphate guanylyltransferase [Fredinandcohnia sp. SECRCQ15]MCH1626414.1 bifunctional adenosylcobinamide kinase/adenosylcobinamide-phosphate guanylyltransferase [Fredinandcohnia sp. SECRCQ15]